VIALFGNLCRDVFPDRPSATGGGAYFGARALQRLRVPARIVTRCAPADRAELLPPLVRLGTPVRCLSGSVTASCAIENDGDTRRMRLEAIGDPWEPADLPQLPTSVRWIHIAPLARSDFPARTLAALARRYRISYDAQGLVRVPEVGPLQLDANFDPAVLDSISILKVAEAEAEVLGDLTALGIGEVVLTRGSKGSTVLTGARAEDIPAHPLSIENPTGAGDAFATTYLVARSAGFNPSGAARRATAVVASVLSPP
jgi:sugar/nucleoside kinase (ribokinase family)